MKLKIFLLDLDIDSKWCNNVWCIEIMVILQWIVPHKSKDVVDVLRNEKAEESQEGEGN